MTREDKLALLSDTEIAILSLDRIVDGGANRNYDQPDDVPELVRKACMDTMMGLTMLKQRLIVEIGTDNL
jgi:hypothetical protein